MSNLKFIPPKLYKRMRLITRLYGSYLRLHVINDHLVHFSSYLRYTILNIYNRLPDDTWLRTVRILPGKCTYVRSSHTRF